MNIPAPVLSIEELYEIYTNTIALTRKDIQRIFGVKQSKAGALKLYAKAKEIEKGLVQYSAQSVRTEEAFESWGIDAKRLERAMKARRKKR